MYTEILRFFEKILKFYRNFRENLGKFFEICTIGDYGCGAPEAREIIKNLVEKSMETGNFFENFHEL